MLKVLENLLKRCLEFGILLKPSKCFFFVRKTKLLGYGISEEGSCISDSMLKHIEELEEPKDGKALLAQLSLFSFSRDYVKNLSKLDAELRECIKDFGKWNQHHLQVWSEIKKAFH